MDSSIPAPGEPCWSTGRPPNSFAALPAGRLGRLGGRIMRRMNAAQQREVAGLLVGNPAADVLELGPGPGVLMALLARRPGVRHLIGIEPSADMRALASRALRAEVAAGRADLRAGTAADTGLSDSVVDLAVSVNTVAIWPDLEAGTDELRRVLRPGGELVLSWHGGREPSRAARALVLPEGQLAMIETALHGRFGDVRRVLTRRCTVFRARRVTLPRLA
ncbi:MAG: class I SAM-dependent methyltransferase [Pseudonocardia sp.]